MSADTRIVVILEGPDARQALAELTSNAQYDALNVSINEVDDAGATDVLALIRDELASVSDGSDREVLREELEAYDAIKAAARPKCRECGEELRIQASGVYVPFNHPRGSEAYCDECDREVDSWV